MRVFVLEKKSSREKLAQHLVFSCCYLKTAVGAKWARLGIISSGLQARIVALTKSKPSPFKSQMAAPKHIC